MTRNNAAELCPAVGVNCVLPGWMPTTNEIQLQRSMGAPEDWVASADAAAPMGRIMRARDCALVVLYLLSPASCMLTGMELGIHPELIPGMLPGAHQSQAA